MSDKSVHNESEFYFPDAELYWKNVFGDKTLPESHRNLLSGEIIQNFLKGQEKMSNVKNIMYDINVFQKFPSEVRE